MKKVGRTRQRADEPKRKTYRHGNLREVMIAQAVELARAEGPEAVVLREVTRRAGVVPNAAYRHFINQQDLLDAVRSRALSALAKEIEREMHNKVRNVRDKAAFGRRSLRAVGTAYLRFAQTETGLFRTAFSAPPAVFAPPDPRNVGDAGLNPFELLGLALDRMVAGGVLNIKHRPNAEFLAWSTVHGMAWLILDGPLKAMQKSYLDLLGKQLLDMVERGLAT